MLTANNVFCNKWLLLLSCKKYQLSTSVSVHVRAISRSCQSNFSFVDVDQLCIRRCLFFSCFVARVLFFTHKNKNGQDPIPHSLPLRSSRSPSLWVSFNVSPWVTEGVGTTLLLPDSSNKQHSIHAPPTFPSKKEQTPDH